MYQRRDRNTWHQHTDGGQLVTTIDLSSWAKRNLWPLPSGEMAIRPGIRTLFSRANTVAAFTVPAQNNNKYWHYIFHEATTPYQLFCTIYDEDFTSTVTPLQTILTNATSRPVTITKAHAVDQVVFSSPDFTALWGYTGGTLSEIVKVTSKNPSTTALDIPRGICTSWVNRVVIAKANLVYFSDATDTVFNGARTFVAENVQPLRGDIYDIFEAAGGSLVCVTSDGVWALPESSCVSGQLIIPNWQKLTDYSASEYGQACVARGRVFGLTQRGFKLIDTEGGDENLLDEPRVNTTVIARISHHDYRLGKMYGTDAGPLVVHPDGGAFHRLDMATGMSSWWTWTHGGEDGIIRGVLRDPYGDEMLVTGSAVYAVGGNFDGGIASTSENATTVKGGYIGQILPPPEGNPVLRRVDYGSDSNGTFYCSVGGTQKTGANSPVDTQEYGNASSVWDTATCTAKQVKSVRFHRADRLDDLGMEIIAEHPLSRMPPSASVEFKGPGRRRP